MTQVPTDDGCRADKNKRVAMTGTQRVSSKPYSDQFYSEANMRHLQKVIKDYEEGKTQLVEHDLIEIDDE